MSVYNADLFSAAAASSEVRWRWRGGEAGVSGVFVRVLAWAVEKKISGVLDGLLKADHNLASLLLRSGGSLKN